jgi:uncharacterized caspase-like protein
MLLRVAVFFLALLLSSAAHAGKRVALVIGNSSYRYAGELANPRNDAADMAAALESHGFAVIPGLDLNKAGLDQKIRDFEKALRGAEVGVFFYAGHGLQVSGQNYIVPTDAQLATPAALELELMRLEVVQRIMESEDRTNILFLDACRDNPLARNLAQGMGTRSTAIGRGLASAQSGHGTLISFSTQPGNVALDGTGRNSPFTGALVKHLLSSNEELMGLLVDVRVEVMRETKLRQIPWEHTALTGRFYFKAPPGPLAPQPQPNDAGRSRKDAVAALERGLAHDKQNDYDLAIAAYSEAIRLDPDDALARANRGNTYSKKNDLDRAIADLSDAIRLEPKFPFALAVRGYAHHRKQDFDRAITDLSEAIRLDPKLDLAFNFRGLAYSGKKDYDRAIADYNEAIVLDPRNAVQRHNRGSAYFQKSDYDRALADFDEAIRLDPNYGHPLYGRGLIKQMRGDKSGDADIAKAKQLNPSLGR